MDLIEVVVVVDTVDCDCVLATGGFGVDLCKKPMSKDAMDPDPKTSSQRGIRRVKLYIFVIQTAMKSRMYSL